MSSTFTYHPVAPRSYAHRLRSKTASTEEVLIITSYDYFLDKKSLATLLKKYREIVLVPRHVDDDYLLNQTVAPLLEMYDDIHLVTNPQYDARYQVVYQLVVSRNKRIRVSMVYDFCENILRKVYVPAEVTENNPTLNPTIKFNNRITALKSIIDVLASVLLLLCSLPVWIISAYRIRRESPGPIFYTQERSGLDDTLFYCIKFRSMGLDAESNGAVFSSKNDTRTFGYGKFMRLFRIDELPQLLNIFKGEISLVGPRPERPVFIESFEEVIPYYRVRGNVKPGITGYAQVMYPYGAGVYDARHKLMYDLYYIKHWSVWMELKIICLTTYVVLTKKGC